MPEPACIALYLRLHFLQRRDLLVLLPMQILSDSDWNPANDLVRTLRPAHAPEKTCPCVPS